MPTGRSSSAAARLLTRHGVRSRDLALALNTTPATVSRWLSGQTEAPPRLRTALIRFVDDPATVDQIWRLVSTARELEEARR